MMKTAMLVSALALSAPVFAQEQTTPAREPVTSTLAQPQTAAPANPTTAQEAPVNTPTAPAETATAPAPQTAPEAPTTETAAATPTEAAAEPVTGAAEIAQVVNTEFATYDKNADTNLDKGEFSAWMVALKSASDPTTKASDPATVKWIDGAFASADTDKSKVVSKDELTKYLSQSA